MLIGKEKRPITEYYILYWFLLYKILEITYRWRTNQQLSEFRDGDGWDIDECCPKGTT